MSTAVRARFRNLGCWSLSRSLNTMVFENGPVAHIFQRQLFSHRRVRLAFPPSLTFTPPPLGCRWDNERPGVPPRDCQDYEDPSRLPRPRKQGTSTAKVVLSGPPNLSRASCPPRVQIKGKGAGASVSFRSGNVTPHSGVSSGGTTTPVHITLVKQRPDLSRASYPGSPSSPRSPRTAPVSGFFEALLHEETDANEQCKERWCERMDSGCLNVHPDEPADLNAWRCGSFKPDDPAHGMHVSASSREQDQQLPKDDTAEHGML
jgi:hypothetical protein